MTAARKKAYFALIVCELLWGASQPLVKPALSFITPGQFLFLRYVVAAPIVIPLIIRGIHHTHFSRRDWLHILITESLNVFNLLLLYTGLQYISSLQSSLIINTRPIFMTAAGVLILAEHEENHEWLGLVISVLGTALLLVRPLLGDAGALSSFSVIGTAITLTTNVIYAVNNLLVKKFYRKLDKLAISGIHMWIGLITFLIFLGFQGQLPSLDLLTLPAVSLAVFYMALFGSVIGLSLSNYGYSQIEVSEATLFTYLQPLVYLPLAVFWLKETINPLQLLGMLFILLGVWWAERRPKQRHLLRHGIPLLWHYRVAEVDPLPEPRQ